MFEKFFRRIILLLAIWDFCLGVFFIVIGHFLMKKYGFGGELTAIPAFFVHWSGFFIVLQSTLHFFLYLDVYNAKIFWLNFLYRAPIGAFHLIQFIFFLHSVDSLITGTLIFFFCGDFSTGGLLLLWYLRKKKQLKW